MVSKCANPACSTPFHYLREGKIFKVEVEVTPPVTSDESYELSNGNTGITKKYRGVGARMLLLKAEMKVLRAEWSQKMRAKAA